MRLTRAFIIALAAAVLAAPLAIAQDTDPDPVDTKTVKGHVVQIRQSTATQNEGAMTEIRVRTRQQTESWFRLGPAEEKGNAFQLGDRVRLRAQFRKGAGADDPVPVESFFNYRTKQGGDLRTADGTLLGTKDRDRLRDGSCDGEPIQDRDRIGRPDSAGQGHHGGGGKPR